VFKQSIAVGTLELRYNDMIAASMKRVAAHCVGVPVYGLRCRRSGYLKGKVYCPAVST